MNILRNTAKETVKMSGFLSHIRTQDFETQNTCLYVYVKICCDVKTKEGFCEGAPVHSLLVVLPFSVASTFRGGAGRVLKATQQ